MDDLDDLDDSHNSDNTSHKSGSKATNNNNNNEWTLVFQGAESRLWVGVYNGRNVVKKERFVKNYRIKELDSKITKERIRAEVKALKKIKEKSQELGLLVPTVEFVDENNIILTRIENSVNVSKYLSEEHSDEMIDKLMANMGQTISWIHNCGVIHGDLTTSNFMITKDNQLIPIDFGLSSFSTTAEDRAVDLYVLERVIQNSYPNINFVKLLDEYDKSIVKAKAKDDVLKRLEAVRVRGRKKLCIG